MKYSIVIITFLFSSISFAQKDKSANKIPVLIRCDDIGMCHAVNVAAKEVLETGMPVSMWVMVPCPWFAEAAELLKKYSNVFTFVGVPKKVIRLCCVLCMGFVRLAKRPTNEQKES